MNPSPLRDAPAGCPGLLSRRNFVKCCGVALASAGCTKPLTQKTPQEKPNAPKVRLVFCETTNDKPIWPNIGYDFDARRKQILGTLTKDCPDVQFFPAKVMDNPVNVAEVLAGDADVDGYVVCVQGLGWRNDIFKLCTTGKPSLLVDNLFGGSGKFLTQIDRIMKSGKPVDWVSSSKDQDIVSSARHFTLLGKGKTAEEVAQSFRATRRKNTPAETDWSCKEDPVPEGNLDEALKRLRETKIIVVGGGWGGDKFRKASQEVVGVTFIPIPFTELAEAYKQADPDAGKTFADRWMKNAKEVVEPKREELEKSGLMYAAMKQLVEKHGARGISINCLGGFYGGHISAFPCLGFCQLNDDGLVGGCEADQMSAMTMATMGVLVNRPGFISDPVIDTSRNCIIYAHCVGTTKPFGPRGASNPYRIRNHSEDRKGAALQSLLPAGCMTTTLEINPVSRQVLIHRAKTTGNNNSDMACRTKLEASVKGDIEKLTENWAMGWHRVTFYGDLAPHVTELCARLKLKLIEEA